MKETTSKSAMAEAAAAQNEPEPEFLRAEEIGATFDNLSPGDKLKIGAVASRLAGGSGLQGKDILQEALKRILMGKRKCPRDVPFIASLINTMRSIASHAREKAKRLAFGADADVASDAPTRKGNPVGVPSPEDDMIAAQEAATVQAIYHLFDDDDEAKLVLMGWEDGLRGKELREAAGLDQAGLDYAIKRIRTRMRRLYPEGWKTP